MEMISNTLYRSTTSVRKQVSMPAWAVETLQRWSGPSSMTKGIVAYESLMLSDGEYRDSLTEIETGIDEELERAVSTGSLESLTKIKSRSDDESRAKLREMSDYADPDETITHVNLHFPAELDEQLTRYGLGSEIAEAAVLVESAPWDSRTERMLVKQQIAALARGESVDDSHPVTDAVRHGADGTPFNAEVVAELRDAVYGVEFYERPGLTIDVLRERGDEVPQTRKYRVPALQTCVTNHEGAVTRTEVIEWADESFGVVDATASSYADEIDFGQSDGVEVDFVSDLVAEQADYLRDEIGEEHVLYGKPDHVLLHLREEAQTIDGAYGSVDEAVEAINSIQDMKSGSSPGGRTKARTALFKRIGAQAAFDLDLDDDLELVSLDEFSREDAMDAVFQRGT